MLQKFEDVLSLKPINFVVCNVFKLMVPKTLLGKANFLLLKILINYIGLLP
jgi:hypothetical protein